MFIKYLYEKYINMRQFRIDDSERDRIINLHESATKRQYLSEQTMEENNINKVIQCFLNKTQRKNIEIDGVIGDETVEAIGNYVGYDAIGDFENDLSKMFYKLKNTDGHQVIWDKCKKEYNPSLIDIGRKGVDYITDLIFGKS